MQRNAGGHRGLLSSSASLAFVAAEAKEKALPPFVGRFTTPLDNEQRLNTRTRLDRAPHSLHKKSSLHNLVRRRDADNT